jgi:hypothetical protein
VTFITLSSDGVADASTIGRADQPRAHHRHVAGVVADAILLLERGVVLLVDHDQPELANGRNSAERRANHDADPALGDRPPGLAPLEAGQARVPGGRACSRSGPRSASATARSARSPAAAPAPAGRRERRGDRLEIDLGLARARHAVEQGRRKGAASTLAIKASAAVFCSADRSGPRARRRLREGRAHRALDRFEQAGRAMVLITDVPTPAMCASSPAGIAGPSFSASSTRGARR